VIAIVGIEAIGDDYRHRLSTQRWTDGIGRSAVAAAKELARYEGRPKAWVARILGTDLKFAFQREFLRGKKDYAEANGTGSRGVYWWYELPEGDIYEVSAPQSWSRADRYFALSTRGQLVRMELDEVIEWFLRRMM
jgi:hypothetical protein